MQEKFKVIIKNHQAMDHDKNIVEEMLKDLKKRFNREENAHSNNQLLGMSEVFRGLVTKEWVAIPNESIDFSPFDKDLVENGVRLYVMC